MVLAIHYVTAAFYLAASVAAGSGLALDRIQLSRVSLGLLGLGAVAHLAGFALLHAGGAAPALNDLPTVLSFTALVGTIAFLLFARRRRLAGLSVFVAPAAFLGVFAEQLELPASPLDPELGAGPLPHAHVLLASAGLALLGLAGLAGLLYLAEHRRLKRKRRFTASSSWPSLESLDRMGALALAAGFPLLTLGVLTGALWLRSTVGQPFTGTVHELGNLAAWAIYAVLVSLRFGAHRPARECAVSAVGGAAVLCLAVFGAGLAP